MNILITGGTGFVGKHLGVKLSEKNNKLYVLTRDKQQSLPYPATLLNWKDLEDGVSSDQIHIDTVINLAGESIAKRWTSKNKKTILDSRIETTSKLVKLFKDSKLKKFISASAIGYYGDRGDELLNEDSGSGSGFLTDVCRRWEDEALKIQSDTSVVIFRFGMVLGKDGGALAKLIPIFQKGLGGVIGDGQMWISWIYIEDLTEVISETLNNNFNGIYNAVSPNAVRNKEFSEKLAESLNKKLLLPIPKVALKILVGEMSEVVLSSQHVSPKHLQAQGFKFRYDSIDKAFARITHA
jgi:uncharacterized protein (TIGR01777 family)